MPNLNSSDFLRDLIVELPKFSQIPVTFVTASMAKVLANKGAGSFHIHRKTMKDLWALAVLGVREQPNLAQNLFTHRH